jgi:vanillate O-demethylase ferredoxin subunit
MDTLSVKVIKKATEALGIRSLELASSDGRPLPAFSAGAHIDLHLGNGLVRQYSLCNDPSDRHRYLIAVLREESSRGGSSYVHDSIRVGDILTISTPRNHFPLVRATHSLLFAGGIGITPVLCMAERLLTAGASFEMHYCTRSVERTAFYDYIRNSPLSQYVHFHFDTGNQEQKLDVPAEFTKHNSGSHLYVCGPSGFIEHVCSTAKAKGWPEEQIHYEHFAAAPQDISNDQEFEVQIASSGERFIIPVGQSITSVLTNHGIDIPVACEQGVCGTCVTRVLDGIPMHRDVYLTDSEHASNDQLTPCCSRSKTKMLVLDL